MLQELKASPGRAGPPSLTGIAAVPSAKSAEQKMELGQLRWGTGLCDHCWDEGKQQAATRAAAGGHTGAGPAALPIDRLLSSSSTSPVDLPAEVERTLRALAPLDIRTPRVTVALLSKPPFRFLFDVVEAVRARTGFGATLYGDQLLMRERETTIPPDDAMEVAKRVKEQYCYVCPDMAKEFRKYDDDPAKWTKKVKP